MSNPRASLAHPVHLNEVGSSYRYRSNSTPHQSVIVGNKSSVHVGPGVFVGQGKGVVPLDDPNAPNKRQCAILEGVSYFTIEVRAIRLSRHARGSSRASTFSNPRGKT
ncbi:hypothetical protein ACVIU7_002091 [Bradyrhizobium liaoningense]|uniref:hypothetical protein n=1 Tax=Bradyrhizobium sp. USDA 241 TaxID=3377725 RepID=UPI0012BC4DA1|nr:hypothetical protein QIH91_02390 [Bradyrhizobium japonicum USDA 135]